MKLLFVVLGFLLLIPSVFAVPEPPGEYIGNLISTQQFSNEPIQIVSTTQNTYYLVTNRQSYYSANGKNWEIKNSSLPTAGGLAIDSSGILYISGSDVYKSVDGGIKWNIFGPAGEFGSISNLKVKVVQGTVYAWHPDKGLYYYHPSLGHWYVVINSSTQFKVYDFIYVDGGMYYLGVQNGEVKLFHGTTPKGTITGATTDSLYPTLYRKLITYYDGALYVALKKTGGGGAIYKSSDLGQSWEKVHDTSSTPASISSSAVNGIQVVATDKVWRSWSGSVWKEVKPFTGGGIDIVSTNVDRQTIIAAGYAVYTYDRNAFPILNLTEDYTIQKNQDLQLPLIAQDLEGDTLTYLWEKVGGPSTYTLLGNTSQTATFKATQDGIYKINASATDSSGGKSTKTVTITVGTGIEPTLPSPAQTQAQTAPNQTIAANAGPDKNCSVGKQCDLGFFEGAPQYYNNTYLWQQISGPPAVIIGNTNRFPKFTPAQAGTYRFNFTLITSGGLSASDDLAVAVSNSAPVIGNVSYLPCIINKECVINASVSDADSDQLTINWTIINQTSDIRVIGSSANQNLVLISPFVGEYVLFLNVSDGKVTDSVFVNINIVTQEEFDRLQAQNKPPVANAGLDKAIKLNEQLKLDGNQSSDPEGYRLKFHWEKISGPASDIADSDTPAPAFTPSSIGVYTIRLTVIDILQKSSSDDVTITVVGENQTIPGQNISVAGNKTESGNKPPAIQLRENIEGKQGEKITVESLSLDPEGSELIYSWEQIGGEPVEIENATGQNLEFTPAKPGIYSFELTVKDKEGNIATKRVIVRVLASGKATETLKKEQGAFVWTILGAVIMAVIVFSVFWKVRLGKN